MGKRLSNEWRERADVCRRVACAAECPESDAVLLESQAEMLMQLEEIYDEHHPPGGGPDVEQLRREVERWKSSYRLLADHIGRTAVARANRDEDQLAQLAELRKLREETERLVRELDELVEKSTESRRLVGNSLRNAGRCSDESKPRWAHVRAALGVGSHTAYRLCREHGIEPDEEIGGNDGRV